MADCFKSEIRDGIKHELSEKVASSNYGKYLKKIRLNKLRSFESQVITFDFPVTALIGPNGGGKTTVLGASACIYQSIKPSQFFAKSGNLDNSMQDWKMEYELIDKTIRPRDVVTRVASYRQSRWNRQALKRDCVLFGVARTVPATERKELRRCASPSFTYAPERIEKLADNVKTSVQRILGKDVSQFSLAKVDTKGAVTLLSGKEGDIEYSEFHFGAGESSVIRMVMGIESLPDNSLILIEEIENGLHPVATIRMVEYLIDVAYRNKSQIIFTTHSNDALKPLPDSAIWASVNGTVIKGKLDVHSLRAITGQVETSLAVFVEDEFAQKWIHGAVRAVDSEILESIEVHPVHGDGTAVKVNVFHNSNPATQFPSICYVDGDSKQEESVDDGVFRLPGEAPESYIYNSIVDRINECKGVLAVALHKRFEDQDEVAEIINNIRLTNVDHHLLFSQLAEKMGFLPIEIVRDAFIYVWATTYPDEAKQIASIINECLAGRKPGAQYLF